MSYQVKAEKVIARSLQDVFSAIEKGQLFLNVGADSSTFKIDFRVGGKYQIDFKRYNFSNFGEFTEIIPNKKVAFSWCQSPGPGQKPDSQVSIELFPEGDKTKMVLMHTGFATQAKCDDHQQGWNGGLADLGSELEQGRLRMIREFKALPEKTFTFFKSPETLFSLLGTQAQYSEVVPNQKMILTLTNSKAILLFTLKNETSTRLEILHDGLLSSEAQNTQRAAWEKVTEKMGELVKS